MKVIMTADIEKLGNKGDIVEVATGYFTNFLNPRNMAVQATTKNIKNLDAMIKASALRDKKEKGLVEEIAAELMKNTYTIKAKSGPSGKLFGSITSADIAKVIKMVTKVDVDKRRIVTEDSIKTVGEHALTLKLHPEVEITLKLVVEAGE
jgi:large subunit ribosomal protein L9